MQEGTNEAKDDLENNSKNNIQYDSVKLKQEKKTNCCECWNLM